MAYDLLQNVRSLSHPLQGRQREPWAFEDELPLELAPCEPPVETLALHNQIGYETKDDMMLLGTKLWPRSLRTGPLVSYLTRLETQVALQHADHFLNLMTPFVVRPYLLGGQGQPVGGVVLTAVSHHKHLQTTGQPPHSMPVRLLEIAMQRLPLEAPIFLQLAHKVPAIIPDALEELFRRIPRIKQDKLGFALEPIGGSG